MSTRTVPYLRGKAVFVTVLVEGPRRKSRFSSNNNHHHNLYVKPVGDCRGYNRKAQLLEYSKQLRASAPISVPSTASQPKPSVVPSTASQSKPSVVQPTASQPQPSVQRQNSQIVPVKSKPRYARVPTCLGNWKLVLPKFLQSFTIIPETKKAKNKKKNTSMASTTTKMKAIVKSFRVERRNIGLFSKLLGKLRKHR